MKVHYMNLHYMNIETDAKIISASFEYSNVPKLNIEFSNCLISYPLLHIRESAVVTRFYLVNQSSYVALEAENDKDIATLSNFAPYTRIFQNQHDIISVPECGDY